MAVLSVKSFLSVAVVIFALQVIHINGQSNPDGSPADQPIRERRNAQIPDSPIPPPPVPKLLNSNRVARQAPPPPPPPAPPASAAFKTNQLDAVEVNNLRARREAKGRGMGQMPTKTG